MSSVDFSSSHVAQDPIQENDCTCKKQVFPTGLNLRKINTRGSLEDPDLLSVTAEIKRHGAHKGLFSLLSVSLCESKCIQ